MTFEELLTPYNDKLNVPSAEEINARSPLHKRLRVTNDYMEVYQSGALSLDISRVIPPFDDDAAPLELASLQDISFVGPAEDPSIEDMPEYLSSFFYLIGSDYGGGFLFQISRGTYRGQLASIEDSHIECFKFKEVDVPNGPVSDDEEANRYIETWTRNILSIKSVNLKQFFEARIRYTKTQ